VHGRCDSSGRQLYDVLMRMYCRSVSIEAYNHVLKGQTVPLTKFNGGMSCPALYCRSGSQVDERRKNTHRTPKFVCMYDVRIWIWANLKISQSLALSDQESTTG
jgi:hypothetical protein